MRRLLTMPVVFLAGLTLALAGCSGESPTSPTGAGGGSGTPTCAFTISLDATSVTPLAGSAVIVRATVKKNGAAVSDGSSVVFTTDFGVFVETGLPSVSKVTSSGFADVTFGSTTAGTAHVKAVSDCGTATISIQFSAIPVDGPYISSVSPITGSCLGGDTVTINGGRFVTSLAVQPKVTFGGAPATVLGTATASQIVVLTPSRTLADASVPESVDVVVTVNPGTAGVQTASPKKFTYTCIGKRVNLTSVNPNTGRQEGNEPVAIAGVNLGTSPATTRVTFGGSPASINGQTDTTVNVTTPKHSLANNAVPETVDVAVTVDLGLPTQQSASLPKSFTYYAAGAGGVCGSDPRLYITQVAVTGPGASPGSPDGGDVVTISGGGFWFSNTVQPTPISRVKVEFGGVQAQVTSWTDSSITVVSPRYTLPTPDASLAVDVKVTVDVGGSREACIVAAKGYTYVPGAYVSSISPLTGSCKGGDTVTINGSRFMTSLNIQPRVTFGGVQGTIVSATASLITVLTPARTPADVSVPETVDVVVTANPGTPSAQTAAAKQFTYTCVDKRIALTSINPNLGRQDGNEPVTILGLNLLPSSTSGTATTRVTFGGVSAVVTGQNATTITVVTPKHMLANPAIPETVDVVVTVDVGLPTQQSASLLHSYTYYASGAGAPCGSDPRLYITQVTTPAATLTSNPGSPDGGEVVTINGAGFLPQPTSRLKVEFGGVQAVATAVSDNLITATAPRFTLANPDSPQSVDIKVTVDVGGTREACVTAVKAYTYFPGSYTTPFITSMSPSTGPNDASTRVTIFGKNFRFPAQVFVTNGISVEATVVSVASNQIVFNTPTATGANASLAGKLATVTVRDTYSGLTVASPVSFQYYPCPSGGTASPATAPWNVSTPVSISGSAFEEPVTAVFSANGTVYALNVVSVSSGIIVVQMPTLDQIFGTGNYGCADIVGQIQISFPSLVCNGINVPFTYQMNRPTISAVAPPTVAQAGGQSVTVTGTNFTSPMSVQIYGGNFSQTVSAVTVGSSTSLTFTAPALPDSAMATETCTVPGAPGVSGVHYTTTTFGVRVIRSSSGCTAELPASLSYTPTDATCKTDAVITTASLAPASYCVPYAGTTITASGGKTPYVFTATGLPAGMFLDPSTGLLSGTPTLPSSGAGSVVSTANVTVTLTDASSPAKTVTRTYLLTLNDTNAPFQISGASAVSIPASGGATALYTATPNPTPAAFGLVSWTVDSIVPAAPSGTIGVTTPNGQTTAIVAAASLPAGSYAVTIRATDNACGTNKHTAVLVVQVTKGSGSSLDISSVPPPNGTLCTPYNGGTGFTFTATGGTTPYTWAIPAGSIPTGLSLNAVTGQLSGTPELAPTALPPYPVTKTFAMNVTVTDNSIPSISVTRTYNVVISDPNAPFTITGTSAQTVAAGGGSTTPFALTPASTPVAFAPVTWTILSVNPAAPLGTISLVTAPSGTSATISATSALPAGTYIIRIQAVDSSCGATKHSAAYDVTLTKTSLPGLDITSAVPPNGTLCTLYTFPFVGAGGTTPYTWQLNSSPALPTGLVFNQATGQLSGTPQLSGSAPYPLTTTYQVTVTLTDASVPALTVSKVYNVVFTDLASPFAVFGPTNQTVGSSGGPVGSFSVTTQALGLATPVTWTVTNVVGIAPTATPPAGSFTLTNPQVTPQMINVAPALATGTYEMTLTAVDNSCGSLKHSASITVRITKLGTSALTLTPPATALTVCTPVSSSFSTAGGVAPYSYAVSGTLPPGLALSTTGNLAGTPTVAGSSPYAATTNYPVSVTVTDSSSPALTTTQAVTFTVADLAAPFQINPASATLTFTAAGGTSAPSIPLNPVAPGTTVNWTIDSIVPAAAAGLITLTQPSSGNSTSFVVAGSLPSGTYTVTLRATDSACGGASRHTTTTAFTLVKQAGAALDINAVTIPEQLLCTASTVPTFTATGGTGTLTWALSSAPALPTGMIFNTGTGALTGTPQLAASSSPYAQTTTYVLSVTVTDSAIPAQTATRTYAMVVRDPMAPFNVVGATNQTVTPLPPSGTSLPTGYTLDPVPGGSFLPVTWTLTMGGDPGAATPPAGTMVLTTTSGTATNIIVSSSLAPGSYGVMLTAVDSTCGSVKHNASLVVRITVTGSALSITSGSMPNGTLCTSYNFPFAAAGGKTPYNWTMVPSNPPTPSGLTINPTTGVVSGTPQLSQVNGQYPANITSSFTVTVTDSSIPPLTVTQTYTPSFSDPSAPFNILGPTNTTAEPGSGVTPVVLAASGAPAVFTINSSTAVPVTWTIANVTVITAGVPQPQLNAIAVETQVGTATKVTILPNVAPGTYEFDLNTVDNTCGTVKHASTLRVRVTKVSGPGVVITNFPPPGGAICTAYPVFQFTASGGTLPLSWTATGVPAGMVLSPSGFLSGTPQPIGNSPYSAINAVPLTVTVTDFSVPALSTSQTFNLSFTDALAPFTIIGNASQTLPTTGGPTSSFNMNPAVSVAWTLTGVPASGITLTAATGTSTAIFVSPDLVPGVYTLTLTATDTACSPVSHTASMTVTITKLGSLPAVAAGTPAPAPLCAVYSFTPSVTGGIAPLQYAVAGSLPPGVTLNGLTGVISGTPILIGSAPYQANIAYGFTYTVTDNAIPTHSQASQNFTINVTDVGAPFVATIPASQTVNPLPGLAQTMSISGGVNTLHWSMSGLGLPAGITLAAATGTLNQIAVDATVPNGTYAMTITVTDTFTCVPNHTSTQAVSLKVGP